MVKMAEAHGLMGLWARDRRRSIANVLRQIVSRLAVETQPLVYISKHGI